MIQKFISIFNEENEQNLERYVYTTYFEKDEPYEYRWLDDRFVVKLNRVMNSIIQNYYLGYFKNEDDFNVKIQNGNHTWAPNLWEVRYDDVKKELLEGQFSCSKCARKGVYSKNTSHMELQTRSADESSTIFVECHTCGYKYRICN